jgi:hypothetical protein
VAIRVPGQCGYSSNRKAAESFDVHGTYAPVPGCLGITNGKRARRNSPRDGQRRWVMIKTLTMLATAATIGIGIAAPSNAHARTLHYWNFARNYRPPVGQIWVRGFQNARTPEQAVRQDFQLDGIYR